MLHNQLARVQNIRQVKQILSFSDDESSDEIPDTEQKVSKDRLEIHQLDVGQGDSALVLFKELDKQNQKQYGIDKSILIDGGTADFSEEYLYKVSGGKKNKKQEGYIIKQGIKKLDCIIFTHLDEDHLMGGREIKTQDNKLQLDSGLQLITEQTLIFKPETEHSTKEKEFKKNFGEFNSQTPTINQIIFNYLKFVAHDRYNISSPTQQKPSYYNGVKEKDNEASIASLITFYKFMYYTAGDISREQEGNISDYYSTENISISGRKFSHHCSITSLHDGQDTKMKTSFVINSFGFDNKHKHPDQRALNLLGSQPLSFIYNTNFPFVDGDFRIIPHNTVIAGSIANNYDGHIIITTTTRKAEKNKFDIRYILKKPMYELYTLYKDKYARFLNIEESLEYIKKYFETKFPAMELKNIFFSEYKEPIEQFPIPNNIGINYYNLAPCNHLLQYCMVECYGETGLAMQCNYYLNIENFDVITRIITPYIKQDEKTSLNIISLHNEKNNAEVKSCKITFFQGEDEKQQSLFKDIKQLYNRKLSFKRLKYRFKNLEETHSLNIRDVELLNNLIHSQTETDSISLRNPIILQYFSDEW